MSSPLLLRLAALSSIGLIGLGLSSLLILRLHDANEKLRRRIVTATMPYLPAAAPDAVELFRKVQTSRLIKLGHEAAWVIGYNPTRRDQYPLPWWVVLLVAIVISRGVAGVLSGLLGSLSGLITPIGALVLCRTFFGWCTGRRSRALFNQMPDALAMIVRSIRVGIPLAEAIRTVGREAREPTAGEFKALSERMAIGVGLEEGLRGMADRNGLAEYRFFATALSLQHQTGGGLTETLENLADVIRKRVALRARGHALASEARASAAILGALPNFAGVILWVLNPSYLDKLFTTTTGQKLLGAAIISFALGLLVMRSIVQRALS